MEIYCWESSATYELTKFWKKFGLESIESCWKKIWNRSGERLTLVGGRPTVEPREHLEQPDRRLKKLIVGEVWEMRQGFVRRGNPIDICGRSCESLSVSRTWECCGSSTAGEVRKYVAQGRTPAESREGHSRPELRLGGILYPTPVPPLPSSSFE